MKNISECSISWSFGERVLIETSEDAELLSIEELPEALVFAFLEDKDSREKRTWEFVVLKGGEQGDFDFDSKIFFDSFLLDGKIHYIFLSLC